MHLHVLPEAKMSSKTAVANLLDNLWFEIPFPKTDLWCSGRGRTYKQLQQKVAKNHLPQQRSPRTPKDQAGVQPAGLASLRRALRGFVRRELGLH